MIAAYVGQIQARYPQLTIEKAELNDWGHYRTQHSTPGLRILLEKETGASRCAPMKR